MSLVTVHKAVLSLCPVFMTAANLSWLFLADLNYPGDWP